MKKMTFKTFLAIAAIASLYSCGGNEEKEETRDADTTVTGQIEQTEREEESTELAFNGEDRGDYMLYGHSDIDVTGDELTIEGMQNEFSSNGAFNGKVAVNINEVCQKAGCWITFNDQNDESVRVFFRDHFTIPVETASGTEAILYGELIQDTLTVDFQKHLLDDAAENGEEVSQEEYDAITEDKIETTFDCESILVHK